MPIANRDQKIFVALLPKGVTAHNHNQRILRGEVAYAYGSTKTRDEFDPLDAVAVRLTQALATRITVKEAARLVVDLWPDWSDGVCVAEIALAAERPIDKQVHLVIADLGDEYFTKVCDLASALKAIPSSAKTIHAVSIERLLIDLRTDAKVKGVALPERLTPVFKSAEYVAWRETVGDPREIEMLHAFVKGGLEAARVVAAREKAKAKD